VGCGAGMRILTGAGAVAVMGPAVLSSHNKGTLLFHDTIHMSQQNTYVTKHHTCHSKHICHSAIHMRQHNTYVTAQQTCHKASSPCTTTHRLQNMQQEVLHSTCAAQVCSMHKCRLTALLHSTDMHMANCACQEAMKAVLLMIIDGCKKPMTACCSSKLLLHC